MKIDLISGAKMSDDEEYDKAANEAIDTQIIAYEDETVTNRVLSGMNTLRQAGQLCDCVLRVGKKLAEFTAHQAVLASVSPYFMSMFEQDPRTEARKYYNVKEATPEVFEILLNYAYTGRLNTSLRNMRDVYQTACQLKFHKVAQYCSDHLMKHISVSNCVDLRNFVGNNPNLMAKTNDFIQANMAAVKMTKSFMILPQINIKLIGYSRGADGTPESHTVAKLISDWLLLANIQDGETATRPEQKFSGSASLAAVDAPVLTQHENVLFLDADNHLLDVSNMDEDVCKMDVVQDYVKACKKYSRIHKTADTRNGDDDSVLIVAHEKVHESLYSVILSLHGSLSHVSVRMHTLSGGSRYASVESGLNRHSSVNSSSSNSSGEEDDKCNGLDHYYQSTLSSFDLLAEMDNSRCGVGLTAWNGKLIAVGGNDRGECLETVEVYDSEANIWSSLPSMSCARGRFDCAVLAGHLYACGGSDGRKELDSVEKFDGQKWSPVAKMSSSKSSVGVGVLNNELYVVGGYNGQRALRNCEVYSDQTKSWSPVAKMNEGRSQAAVCSVDGLLYVFGGTDSWNCFSSVEVYNPATNHWSFVAPMSQARRGATATVYNGKVHVAGGSDGSKSLDSVEVYDYSTNTWTPGPSLQVPRANAGLAVLAGRLYIVGGYEKNSFLASMEVLEGDADSKWCSYHKNTVLSSSESDPDH